MSAIQTIAALLAAGTMLTQTAGAAAQAGLVSITDVRAEVASGWRETYKTKWRDVPVDVSIRVPEADRLPIVRVRFMPKLPDEAVSAYREGMESFDQTGAESTWRWYHREGKWSNGQLSNHDGCFSYWPIHENATKSNQVDNAISIETEYRLTQDTFEWDRVYAENSAYTLRDMDGFYRDWMERLYPNEDIAMELYKVNVLTPRRYKGKNLTQQGEYWAEYRQLFYGVPVLDRVIAAFRQSNGKTAEQELNLHQGGDGSCVLVTDEDYSVTFRLYREESVLCDDAAIRPFSDVKDVMEKQIQQGFLRKIGSIELGYLAYPDPDDNLLFWLLPSWRVKALWEDDPRREPDETWLQMAGEDEEEGMFSLFYDAQTGEWIDHTRTDKNRCIPPTG